MEKSSFADFLTCPSVLSAVFVGGCVLLLAYILKSFRNASTEEKDQSEPGSSTVERKKDSAVSKQKKKQNWTRSADQAYAQPWLLKTLKNHTGQVHTIDFSSNGKYLASCGEEEPDPDPDLDMNSSSGSECNKENSRPPSADPSPRTKGLSRRQRKNRRREDSSPDSKKKKESKREPLTQFKLSISERVFVALLHPHMLTKEQLYVGGFPVQSPLHNNSVVFLVNSSSFSKSRFDVNAREFVPRLTSESRDASDSEESSGSEPDASFYVVNANVGVERLCARCGRGFFTTDKEYLTQERCVYHWGKLLTVPRGGVGAHYSCCNGKPGSLGCTTCKLHVWSGVLPGLNGPFEGYVKTRQRRSTPADGNYGVYALDCEMCYTVAGLELTRVTVVAVDGKLVYDSFVKPVNEIIDYNTRFSGITAKDLNHNAKKLREVQNDLRGFINADTILIGHGLENDLRALKLVHKTVVDTALVFPHYHGFPYRRSLRQLVSSYLKKEVQCGSNGHDSYEDACACMELVKYKIWKENKDFIMM
ncbi:uncharacterized protein LOC135131923 isoform X2 [Zophobas morio]|uniref:uncharacterized protein LOC135131923 isoform X2 n=1 Tax=Zophobas morio TaxID=2755281 RepID=UPI003083E92A